MTRSRQKVNGPYLPLEIIGEILLLLPFESIIVFKVVSKKWRNLINHPNFIHRYRGRPLYFFMDESKNESSLYCVLARYNNKITGNDDFFYPGFSDNFGHPSFSVCRIPIECNTRRTYWYWYWSVGMAPNGMVCVKEDENHSFHLYNLFTGSRRIVKSAPMSNLSCICYGFGYDSVEYDYKIFVVWEYDRRRLDSDPGFQFQCEDNDLFWVYSFRNDGWMSLKGFPYAVYDWERLERDRVCTVNGILHWLVLTRDYGNKLVIVTYDLHTSRFGKILLPAGFVNFQANLSELGGGNLYCSCYDVDKVQIWVMKEYGVEESWMKLFSVDTDDFYMLPAAALYECNKAGRKFVLFASLYYGTLCWYNIDTHDFKYIGKSTWRRCKVVGGGRGRTYRQKRIGNKPGTSNGAKG